MADLILLGEYAESFLIDIEAQYNINQLYNASLSLSFFYNSKDTNTEIKPMFVFSPMRTGLKGFYLGIYPIIGLISKYSYWNEKNDFSVEFGVGLKTGYKWIFNNGFTLQLGTGISKTFFPYYFDNYGFGADGRKKLELFDLYLLDFKMGYSF